MSTKLKELQEKLNTRRTTLARVFEEAGPDYDMAKVTVLEGDTPGKVEQIRAMNNELADIGTQIEQITASEGSPHEWDKIQAQLGQYEQVARPAIHRSGQVADQAVSRPHASIGQLFVESEAYTGRRERESGPSAELPIGLDELAATMTTAAGWAPATMRTDRVVEMALRPLQVTDLVPKATTTAAAITYMEETVATNAAAERAEGGVYAESTLTLTERSVTNRSIGTSIPITDEQLEDVAQAQSYVEGRMGFFVLQRVDGQLVNGDGTAPNIRGYLNATGLQTQAKGADPAPDAIYKAMTKIRVNGRAFPSGVVMHPTDWQNIRLLRTADGIYVWGSPSEAGLERIWGSPVAQSDAITLGTSLVGDFSPAMSQFYLRRGLEVQLGYVNDDFKNGKQTVRAGIRGALVVYRGAAFCTVTGL